MHVSTPVECDVCSREADIALCNKHLSEKVEEESEDQSEQYDKGYEDGMRATDSELFTAGLVQGRNEGRTQLLKEQAAAAKAKPAFTKNHS